MVKDGDPVLPAPEAYFARLVVLDVEPLQPLEAIVADHPKNRMIGVICGPYSKFPFCASRLSCAIDDQTAVD